MAFELNEHEVNYLGDNYVFEAGLELIRAGISIVPLRWRRNPDGTPHWIEKEGSDRGKDIPPFKWGEWQYEVMSEDTFISEWNRRRANTLALESGGINRIYTIEFDKDAKRIFPAYMQKVNEQKIIKNNEVHIEGSISNGYHFSVKLPEHVVDPGNTHYADPAEGKKPYIESRGTGGVLFIAPSYGYTVVPGYCDNFADLPEITEEQFLKLEAIARTFDEKKREEQPARTAPAAPSAPSAGMRPGDDYNARATMESVIELLQQHGWRLDYTSHDTDNIHLTRPGKAGGTSATLREIEGVPIFYVFSSSCPEFEPEVGYNPYSVYTKLEHNGNFPESAACLAQQGYGDSSYIDNCESSRVINGIRLRLYTKGTKKGLIKNDLTTVTTILSEDPKYAGMAKVNELEQARGPVLVRRIEHIPSGTPALADSLTAYIINDINTRYNHLRIKAEDLKVALIALYSRESFNPFRDFVESCQWDGKKRVETLLIDCFGCDDTALARESITNWLLAAYARQRKPGLKFDYALTVTGMEGLGKSSFMKKMFDPYDDGDNGWNVDGMHLTTLINDKLFIEGAGGKVGVELAEFAGSKKVEVDELKNALTKCSRQLRTAYAPTSDRFLIRQVFWVNTNEETFLQSMTGNRRFWIVKARRYNLDILTEEYVKQIWGEVKAIYDSRCNEEGVFKSYSLLLGEEATEQAFAAQQRARIAEPWESAVAQYFGAVSHYTVMERQENGVLAKPIYTNGNVCHSNTLWKYQCAPVVGRDGISSADGRKLKSFISNKLHWSYDRVSINKIQQPGFKRPEEDSNPIYIPYTAIEERFKKEGNSIPAPCIEGYKTAPKYWEY